MKTFSGSSREHVEHLISLSQSAQEVMLISPYVNGEVLESIVRAAPSTRISIVSSEGSREELLKLSSHIDTHGRLSIYVVPTRAFHNKTFSFLVNGAWQHLSGSMNLTNSGLESIELLAEIDAPDLTDKLIAFVSARGLDISKQVLDTRELLSKLRFESIATLVSQEAAKAIARDPETLQAVEWRDLERIVAAAIDGLGFKVELTAASGDEGKDVLVYCRGIDGEESYAIEVKHWRSGKAVGHSIARNFVSVVFREGRVRGLLLSTSGFAKNIFESVSEVEQQRIVLGGHAKLVWLCRSYAGKAAGLLVPQVGIAEIFDAEVV